MRALGVATLRNGIDVGHDPSRTSIASCSAGPRPSGLDLAEVFGLGDVDVCVGVVEGQQRLKALRIEFLFSEHSEDLSLCAWLAVSVRVANKDSCRVGHGSGNH